MSFSGTCGGGGGGGGGGESEATVSQEARKEGRKGRKERKEGKEGRKGERKEGMRHLFVRLQGIEKTRWKHSREQLEGRVVLLNPQRHEVPTQLPAQ